jgi:hypothetical protein
MALLPLIHDFSVVLSNSVGKSAVFDEEGSFVSTIEALPNGWPIEHWKVEVG